MNRRVSCLVAALLCWVLAVPASGWAQGYPNKPVRLVVPFPAGGPADALGRVLADQLNKIWGQPVIVENRGGAGGNIGADVVARAAPDGYTLLLNASSHVINASLYEKLPYDPVKDFTPVSEVASYMLVLVVHPSVPATSVKDFVAFAKGKPDGLSVANAGSGPRRISRRAVCAGRGVNLIHVPYRGAAPASTDLIAGQVPAMFNNPVNAVPQVKANNLRALAATGSKRLSLLPDFRRSPSPATGIRNQDLVRPVRSGRPAGGHRAQAACGRGTVAAHSGESRTTSLRKGGTSRRARPTSFPLCCNRNSIAGPPS
jgi:tripartite-type tricarboxylate transporter receptor subunit TctC